MKKTFSMKKITAFVLAAVLLMSVASCSTGNGKDDTKETTEAETVLETNNETEESSEETASETMTSEETVTVETTTEAATEAVDPDTDMYTDLEVRDWARWYLDNGYHVEYMNHDDAESYWGKGTNVVEGFAAGTDNDNLFTLDYVMKFEDYESAENFITELEENGWGPVERTDNGGSHNYTLGGGIWEATLSANNVLRFVCLDL